MSADVSPNKHFPPLLLLFLLLLLLPPWVLLQPASLRLLLPRPPPPLPSHLSSRCHHAFADLNSSVFSKGTFPEVRDPPSFLAFAAPNPSSRPSHCTQHIFPVAGRRRSPARCTYTRARTPIISSPSLSRGFRHSAAYDIPLP